jgi:hypothetical protein
MTEVRPQIYMPFLQTMPSRLQMTYTIRTEGGPESVVGLVRQAVAKLDIPLFSAPAKSEYEWPWEQNRTTSCCGFFETNLIFVVIGILSGVALSFGLAPLLQHAFPWSGKLS